MAFGACQGVKLSPSIDTHLCYPAVTPQALGCQAGCGSFVAEAVISRVVTLGFLGDILGRHSYAIDTAMWAKVCLAFKFRSTSLA